MSKKTFWGFLVLVALLSSLLTYLLTRPSDSSGENSRQVKAQKAIERITCPQEVLRLNVKGKYKYVSPLLLSDIACSSPELDTIKNQVESYILEKKKSGLLTQASVYLKTHRNGYWFEINGNAMYNPGSLMKVAIMLTYLRDSEERPGLLDNMLVLNSKINDVGMKQIRTSAPLELGKSYSVRNLITEMIVNSDNDATDLLNRNINRSTFASVMSDLGSRTPDLDDPNFEMSVLEYNRYLRVLYNGSYLNRDNSDWALSLLTKSNYKGALVKLLPNELTVAHKFGERPYQDGFNFHEGGIVYLKNNPYTVVVMTKGKDYLTLPELVADISKLCYEGMKKL
ncbi:MAG: serine hydrolase [Flavobacteriales bacterium]|jgi:beta-lactamase class A